MFLTSFLVLFAVVALAGCNLPSSQSETDDAQSAQTLAAQTIEARLTENAAGGVQPTEGGDNPPADTQAPTDTLAPSSTPLPSNTSAPSPTNTSETPCNKAAWVKDVTVPDGTELTPGTTFTKTWRVKNVGTCTWTNDYDLVFDDGDQMDGDAVVNLSIGTVEPNETVDLSVDLKAPSTPGDYRGDWLIRSDDSEVFGLGNNDVPIFVEIKVVDPVSFSIVNTNVYDCGGDNFVALQIKNTGTEILESFHGSVKNLDTSSTNNYGNWDTPFTENKNDCPVMNIDNIEPGDLYYIANNMGSASAEFEFTVILCTQEGGGGDCHTEKVKVNVP
ncbi:MAG: NBR1-Ig-like domain-containing protein [Anaerolineales bacterium]